nr:MAG TPA: hypothetical protein [Crassvirales sp.]
MLPIDGIESKRPASYKQFNTLYPVKSLPILYTYLFYPKVFKYKLC